MTIACGGLLVAAGSAGLAQAPGTTSTQCSLMATFSSSLAAGTLCHLRTSDGREIITVSPERRYQSLVFSSADLIQGGGYSIYYGGSCDGDNVDGICQGGTYSPGTLLESFVISQTVTRIGG